MEFIQGIVGRFKEFKRVRAEALAELKAHHRTVEEQYAEDLLTRFYVGTQQTLGQQTSILRGIRRQGDQTLVTSEGRESVHRVAYNALTHSMRIGDKLGEGLQQSIFDTIGSDQPTRDRIVLSALRKAEDYWQEQLMVPDLSTDERMTGMRRLTMLRQRIDLVTPPKEETPNSPQ